MSENILALANPMLNMVFGIAFLILWRREPGASWIAIISVSYFASAAGFFIFHLTPDPNGIPAVVAMHLFYSLGTIAMVWGIGTRYGQLIPHRLYGFIAGLGLVMMVGASFGADYNARLYAANASYGLILALGTQAIARKAGSELLDKAILFLLAMGAFQFFVRPLVAIMVQGEMTAVEYRETPFYAVMVVWLALAAVLMALILLGAALTDQTKAVRDDAERDTLTGLKVRGPFETQAIAMLQRAREEDVPISVIVADIDHFKRVNDIWGHQVGDSAIAGFGDLLRSAIRSTDIAGRVGGEEFCLFVWDCPAGPTRKLAERIRTRFEHMQIEGISDGVRLTASFGIAQWEPDEGYGRLFARADAALYRAKQAGRNRIVSQDEGMLLAMGPHQQGPDMRRARV
ncbi:MAG: GGDEF domain-containing protein [Erythrobacter sp.]|nr:MAG: GGDEF domain-containing protein [Erythrobacter sp.]